MYALSNGSLAYIPITKNGSTTYTAFFKSLGWTDVNHELLSDSCIVASHIQDPIVRHFKGTAEFIVLNNLEHLVDNSDWLRVWYSAVMDIHSYPITWSLGQKWVDRIHWLPLSEDHEMTNKILIEWLSKHGLEVSSPVVTRNVGNSKRKEIFNKLMKYRNSTKNQTLSYFYDADIILHSNLLGSK